MRKIALVLALAALAVSPVVAQTPAAPAVSLPASFYAVGASYNPSATPSFAGTLLYAKAVTVSGAASSTLAFSVVDVLPENLKTLTVSTNIGVGVAARIATVAGHTIYAPTSAGISYTGANTGWNWTTGAAVPFKLSPTKSYYVVPNVRILKSSIAGGYQLVPGVLFGWGQ